MSGNQQTTNPGIIITGASSGIGRAIAIELAQHGYDLFLSGRSADGLKETREAVAKNERCNCKTQVLDVAKPGALAGYVEEVSQIHPYLFALVNNAGVMHPEPILSGGRADRWRAMMDINYFAPLEGSVAAIAAMRRHKRPAHIINVSSIASGMETLGPYAASKKALEIISEALRSELQDDDVRITTLVPGTFATQLGRDFSPELVAQMMQSAKRSGQALDSERLMGDPVHLARAVAYIVQQPANINIQRMVIRPAADLTF